MKRLYRSENNRQIAGICGGLADYFNVDATIIRIIFLILLLAVGNGALIYFVLWFVMPEESDVRMTDINADVRKRKNTDVYDDTVY